MKANNFIKLVLILSLSSCSQIEKILDLNEEILEEGGEVIQETITAKPPQVFRNPQKDGKQEWDHIATGTIYKPKSDRQPSRVVFISGPEFQQVFDKVVIDGKEAYFEKWSEWDSSKNYDPEVVKNAKEAGNWDEEKNAPLRQVWRTNFTCNQVASGSSIFAYSEDKIYSWQIGDACTRK